MKKLVAVAAAAFAVGCADRMPTEPVRSNSVADQEVELAACPQLRVDESHKLAMQLYAHGVQIYKWNGTTWVFDAPLAVLTANAGGTAKIADHYRGPTWESNSGSKVVAALVERCTPNPNAIQWLLLSATSTEGPGPFDRVTYIQRINTAGGLAPTAPGDFINQEARVPYTTEYLFYRQK